MFLLFSIKGLHFSPVSNTFTLLAAVLLLVLLAVHVYAQRGTRISTGRRRLLAGLRTLALLCVLLALLGPTLSLEADRTQRPRVFVLLDNSASMGLPFDPSPTADSSLTRAEVATGAARRLVEGLPGRFETSVFLFSDDIRQPGGTLKEAAERPTGARSALGSALEKAASEVGAGAAAVVLVSDGSSSFGPDPSGVAKRLRLPVYALAAAKEGPVRDVQITGVMCPASGYAGAEVPVLVRVKGHGLENLEVPVMVFEEGAVVSRGMLKLAGSAETELLLSVRPRSAGIHFYSVSIPAVTGELSAVNNAASFALSVMSEKLKVLYLQGDLSWDFTFLKRQMEFDPRLEPTFVLVSDGETKARQPTFPPPVEFSPGQLAQSSVVLLDDGAAARMSPGMWKALESFVGSGRGLFVLGSAGLAEAPAAITSILPARIRKAQLWGRQEYLNCRLTSEGSRHPICDVEREASSNARAWEDVTPLVGAHSLESAKQGSSVLIEATRGEEHFPLVVAGQYGRGRVLHVAASGLWRWDFTLPAAGGSETLFERFVSNGMWWLSESEQERVGEVRPTSWVFKHGEEVTFTARASEGLPGPSPEVTNEAGELLEPISVEERGGAFETSFGVLSPGGYQYRFSTGDGNEAALPGGKFVVDTMGPEHGDPFPDPALLAYVSEASGGKFFRADEVDELRLELESFGRKATVERQVKLWNHPLLFAVFAASMALEWWLRRRSGLP
ncbi:MAG: VWA domain-containing protein [Candidatus Eiseniibacteriota bacterium]|nr:MAG: VWA domain-containing protein [Candidatus Eisenbacteria bacterium]